MIVDRISNLGSYRTIAKGLETIEVYVKTHDMESMDTGIYTLNQNVYFTVKEYYAKKTEEIRWETHRQYMDLQYLISGGELMGYAPVELLEKKGEYDEAGDCSFYEFFREGDYIRLRSGMFALLLPQDAHFPSLADGEASFNRKVIFKIRI